MESLEHLRDLSFLDSGYGEKLMLTPAIISYIDDTIDQKTKRNYTEKICFFYEQLLE